MSTSPNQPPRSEVAEKYTWDLSKIFATDEAWKTEYDAVKAMIPSMDAYKGKLVRSGKQVLAALTARDAIAMRIERLYSYAHMKNDQDTTNDTYIEMQGVAYSLYTDFTGAISWMDPELLRIRAERLSKWVERYPGLAVYRREFQSLQRRKPHTLSAGEERITSLYGDVAAGPQRTFGALTNSDMDFGTIEVDGESVGLNQSSYTTFFLENHDRAVREEAFRQLLGCYGAFSKTLASTYSGNVKKEIAAARARGYKSTREMNLAGINMPVSVYDSLIDTINANLDKMHRYAALRKRVLGVADLQLWDMYVPLVPEKKYTFEEACEIVLKAVEPLGKDYVEAMRAGIVARWIDVVSNKGKVSGAYSGGDYLTVPYVLLNWMGTLGDVYTLAHELGHSMHSWFTRRTQPYQTGSYTLFVAEVASTTNEQLLTRYLLSIAKTATEKRCIINQALEGYRGTLFRQAMFAEFEMQAHALAESGKPLTPDTLAGIHKTLNEKYFGPGVVIDDLIKYEWSRIPHFYNSFYVYQYATGISAATVFARLIFEEGQPAVERYLNFLRSGSSKDSLDLLREVGADLSTHGPVQEALDNFERLIEQFEALL